MKAILHIGPSKTGTSYIQAHLHRHSDALADRRILYPSAGKSTTNAEKHDKLFSALRNERYDDVQGIIREIRQTNAATIILSEEGFAALPEAALKCLHQQLGMDTRVVFYHRSWVHRVPSAFQQGVRAGRTESFPEWLVQHVTRPWKSQIINPAVVLDRFANIFGVRSIQIIDFNEAVSNNLFHHFLSTVLDTPADLAADPQPRNSSSNPLHTEVIRVANVLRQAGEINDTGWKWRIFHKQAVDRGLDELERQLAPFVRSITLRGDDAPYNTIFASASERYGNDFKLERGTAQFVSPSYLAMPSIHSEMRRVCGI